MALIHEFLLIKKSKEIPSLCINKVNISDDLILYINDSLYWIESLWNGNINKNGLNYYGFTIIENVEKLKLIISSWIKLFEIAPENFIITNNNFLVEENKYEKNLFNKQSILFQLNSLLNLCEMAIIQNKYILHNGI